MRASLGRVIQLRHSFEFLRLLRDRGPMSFSDAWRALGCYPKSMATMVKRCFNAGLVQPVATGRGYELTDKGFRALVPWEELISLDGEPDGGFERGDSGLHKAARVRAALEQYGIKPVVGVVRQQDGGFVADGPLEKGQPVTLAPGERFIELDDDAALDPFGPGGSE